MHDENPRTRKGYAGWLRWSRVTAQGVCGQVGAVPATHETGAVPAENPRTRKGYAGRLWRSRVTA